jgi:hypothetical protein
MRGHFRGPRCFVLTGTTQVESTDTAKWFQYSTISTDSYLGGEWC